VLRSRARRAAGCVHALRPRSSVLPRARVRRAEAPPTAPRGAEAGTRSARKGPGATASGIASRAEGGSMVDLRELRAELREVRHELRAANAALQAAETRAAIAEQSCPRGLVVCEEPCRCSMAASGRRNSQRRPSDNGAAVGEVRTMASGAPRWVGAARSRSQHLVPRHRARSKRAASGDDYVAFKRR
jgi:hypothetical protein